MKTLVHTPGPWHYGQAKSGASRVFSGNWEIVRAMSAHGLRKVPKEEREANARLIAAAPDLLQQLEALVVQIEHSNRLIVPLNVRLAINKARGIE